MGLAAKLQIKPDMSLGIFNAPEENSSLPDDLPVAITNPGDAARGSLDALLFFVPNRAELEQFAPQVLPLIRYDGLLWLAYPKKTGKIKSDITRDEGWDVVNQEGLRPIRQISIDETWSALRFRPIDRVGR